MSSILTKSIRLNRFHMMVVIIITAIIIFILLKYSAMIMANTERLVFNNNLTTLMRILSIRQLLNDTQQQNCRMLDSPQLFQQETGLNILQPH